MKKVMLSLIVVILLGACSGWNITVGVLPMKGIEAALTDTVARAIEKQYGYITYILPATDLPSNSFINIKSPRYRADTIIAWMREIKPDTLTYILGLTHFDISTTKYDSKGNMLEPEWKYQDWGIFGLGYRPGVSCVVSTYRLKSSDEALFFARLKKVSLHELGHNFGLPHCPTRGCVMQDAVEKIATVDSVGYELCTKCKRQI